MFALGNLERFGSNRLRKARLQRIKLLLRVFSLVALIAAAKVAVHRFGWEVIQLNPLFTTLVASTVFLLGFLLNGVLADYKESEKLPAELATGLEVLSLEIKAISIQYPDSDGYFAVNEITYFAETIVEWLLNRVSTSDLLKHYYPCHRAVVKAAILLKSDPPLKARLLGEMAAILKLVNRIETIRETSFVKLVYWLAYAAIGLLCGGLILMANTRLHEAIFFIVVISLMMIFLISLIGDLDNPFGYGDPMSAEDISLDVLTSAVKRMQAAQ